MKTILFLTLILGCNLGCNYIYNQTYVGTIRNTNYINGWTYITVEPDNNTTPVLINLCKYQPQLWKGEYVEIRISTSNYDNDCWTLDSYVRLGPDR